MPSARAGFSIRCRDRNKPTRWGSTAITASEVGARTARLARLAGFLLAGALALGRGVQQSRVDVDALVDYSFADAAVQALGPYRSRGGRAPEALPAGLLGARSQHRRRHQRFRRLEGAGPVGRGLEFAWGNYDAVVQVMSRYPLPGILHALAFVGVLLWQVVGAVLLWRAAACYRGLAGQGLAAVYWPLALLIGQWAAFLVVDDYSWPTASGACTASCSSRACPRCSSSCWCRSERRSFVARASQP